MVSFLESNPFEVVTLLFVNTGVPLRQWAKAFFDSGADVLSFVPPPWLRYRSMRIGDWPTISEMVANNQRLVTFLSNGANPALVPYLLPEFQHVFETDFGITAPDQYTCAPARPRWPGSYVPDCLSLVDHFLYAEFLGISEYRY